MRAYGDSMRAAARRWAERIPRGTSTPILDTCQGITLDIIIEAIFGERDPAKVTDLHAGILALVASFNPLLGVFKFLQRDFFGLGPWVKFQACAKALHERIDALIALRRSTPGDDILSMLLAVRDDQGAPLSDQEVHEQLVTFIVAGHETTATTLAWAMDHLHRAPDTLATLRAELATASSPDALARLPYLDAVWQETLRLHPPVPVVSRKLTREFVLKGHALPAGTTVGFAVYMAHLRPEVFPEPKAFKPERFVQRAYSPFEYAPFGGGARRCLGAAFAAYELKIVLATLLEGRSFRLDEPAPVRSAFRIGTYGPETGVRMTLLP
jgi:cytochrome P450